MTARGARFRAAWDGLRGELRSTRRMLARERTSQRVAIVDEAMARLLWPDTSPLGRTFRLERVDADPIEVIGVVSTAAEPSRNQRPQAAFYRPFPQEYAARMTVVMRAQGDPAFLFGTIRRTIREVDHDLSIVDLRTMGAALDDVAGQRRIPATALSLVGALGLLLSTVGLYGVVAYGVRERARELGIRLALGARPADIRRLVLRQGFAIVGIGMSVGAAASVVFTRVVRSTVFGVGSLEPATVAAVCGVLMAAGFGALYLPGPLGVERRTGTDAAQRVIERHPLAIRRELSNPFVHGTRQQRPRLARASGLP